MHGNTRTHSDGHACMRSPAIPSSTRPAPPAERPAAGPQLPGSAAGAAEGVRPRRHRRPPSHPQCTRSGITRMHMWTFGGGGSQTQAGFEPLRKHSEKHTSRIRSKHLRRHAPTPTDPDKTANFAASNETAQGGISFGFPLVFTTPFLVFLSVIFSGEAFFQVLLKMRAFLPVKHNATTTVLLV